MRIKMPKMPKIALSLLYQGSLRCFLIDIHCRKTILDAIFLSLFRSCFYIKFDFREGAILEMSAVSKNQKKTY